MGLTVNRQKRNIFTANRQMSEPKLAVKFLFISFSFFFYFLIFLNIFSEFFIFFFNFFKQLLIIGLIPVFKCEQNYNALLKLRAKFVINVIPKN